MSVPIPQFQRSFTFTVSIGSRARSTSIYSTDGIMFPIIVLADWPVGSSPPASSAEPSPAKGSAWSEIPAGGSCAWLILGLGLLRKHRLDFMVESGVFLVRQPQEKLANDRLVPEALGLSGPSPPI